MKFDTGRISQSDYNASCEISRNDPPFYALLCCLIRKADSRNLELIWRSWPKETEAFIKIYNTGMPDHWKLDVK